MIVKATNFTFHVHIKFEMQKTKLFQSSIKMRAMAVVKMWNASEKDKQQCDLMTVSGYASFYSIFTLHHFYSIPSHSDLNLYRTGRRVVGEIRLLTWDFIWLSFTLFLYISFFPLHLHHGYRMQWNQKWFLNWLMRLKRQFKFQKVV